MAIGENIDAQKLLQKFERMPAPARSGVLGAIAFVVVGLYMVLFFGSNQTQLRALQTRHAKVEQDIVMAAQWAPGTVPDKAVPAGADRPFRK